MSESTPPLLNEMTSYLIKHRKVKMCSGAVRSFDFMQPSSLVASALSIASSVCLSVCPVRAYKFESCSRLLSVERVDLQTWNLVKVLNMLW